MKTFTQFNELANKPYKLSSLQSRKGGSEYEYEFRTDQKLDGVITFAGSEHIDDYDEMQWKISFTIGGYDDETGKGDEFRIFATVIQAIREFIKKEDPKYMTLIAQKTSGAKGRESLYARLLKKYMGSKYKISANKDGEFTFFDIEKK